MSYRVSIVLGIVGLLSMVMIACIVSSALESVVIYEWASKLPQIRKQWLFLFLGFGAGVSVGGAFVAVIWLVWTQIKLMLKAELDRQLRSIQYELNFEAFSQLNRVREALERDYQGISQLLDKNRQLQEQRKAVIACVSKSKNFSLDIRKLGFEGAQAVSLELASSMDCSLMVFDGNSLTDEEVISIVNNRSSQEVFVGFRSGIFQFDPSLRQRFIFSNSLLSSHARIMEALDYLQGIDS